MNRLSFTALGLVLASMAFFPACGSAAQQKAQDGANLLAQCDMRDAHTDFVDAYNMDPSDPSIALAFALTDLTLLPEDPALEPLRPRFGFRNPFDTTFLWEKGGLLDQASQKSVSCGTLGDFVRTNLSNPALDAQNPMPFLQVIDPSLTFGDLRTAGVALAPRFDKLSQAFETAANAAGSSGVDIQGGCGANDMVIQQPELYALAGTFALLEAAFQLALVYDGSARLYPLFMEIAGETGAEADFVADMNSAFLHVADATQAPAAQTLFVRAFQLFISATKSAQAVQTTPANAVIDWTSFPKLILTDAQTLAQSAHDAFGAATPIPFLNPTVTVDGPSFISNPLELAPLNPAAWSLDSSNDITFTSDQMESLLGARMTPSPFTSNANYSWTFTDDISNATNASPSWGSATFDPQGRFSTMYACQ
jgi:hypothetical protein